MDAARWMGTDRGAQAVLAAGVQQRLARVTDLIAEVDRNPRPRRRQLMRMTLAGIEGGAHALTDCAKQATADLFAISGAITP